MSHCITWLDGNVTCAQYTAGWGEGTETNCLPVTIDSKIKSNLFLRVLSSSYDKLILIGLDFVKG